jgi:methanogenic corrinoid protein MtbC1
MVLEDCRAMARSPADSTYPIAAVSKLTGVSCHALRVWERRYGFPVPQRAPSGHRRYSLEQVLILQRLSEMSHEGRSIGDLIADHQAGRLQVDIEPERPRATLDTDVALAELLDRLHVGDLSAADLRFDRLRLELGPIDLIGRIIGPALTETGERWFRRRCSVYQERCISGFLRHKLASLIGEARRANAQPSRTALIGTVQGDRHEGGVLIVQYLLERAGWRVISLGVDVPVTEYEKAVADLQPDVLALSFVLSRNINKRFQELSRLRDVPVYVGGRSILNYQKLARSYGLIPIPGAAPAAVTRLLQDYQEWSTRMAAEITGRRHPPTSTERP